MKNIGKLENCKLNLMNLYSCYDYNGYSMQELLCEFFEGINSCIETVNDMKEVVDWLKGVGLQQEVVKQLNVWLNDGTLKNIINQEIFEELNNDIQILTKSVEKLTNEVPYKDYSKGYKLEGRDKSLIYEGHTIMAGETYGRADKACIASVIAGEEYPTPEVLDTSEEGLATYTNRDSVSLYVHNNGRRYLAKVEQGCSYSVTGVLLPSGFDVKNIKNGMILHSGDNYVGVVTSIEGLNLTCDRGWFKIGSGVKGVPDSVSCIISPSNKIWGINSNIFVREGMPAGANVELGVFCDHANINDVGGLDIVNFEQATHYGVKVRGRNKGFNVGFTSSKSGVHFEGKDREKSAILIRSINSDGTSWQVNNEGIMDSLGTKMQTITQSSTISPNVSFVRMQGSNINATLQLQPAGRRIVFVSEGTGNMITAPAGSGIKGGSVNAQQISIAATSTTTTRTIELISIGNSWRILYDWK